MKQKEITTNYFLWNKTAFSAKAREIFDHLSQRAVQFRKRDVDRMVHTGVFSGLGEAQERIDQEIYRCRRYQRTLSVVLLDLPVSGRDASAPCQTLDRLLADRIRRTDFCLRFDPAHRIAVVCPETDQEEAEALADRLQILIEDNLARLGFMNPMQRAIASFPEMASTFEGLLASAGDRLRQVSLRKSNASITTLGALEHPRRERRSTDEAG